MAIWVSIVDCFLSPEGIPPAIGSLGVNLIISTLHIISHVLTTASVHGIVLQLVLIQL